MLSKRVLDALREQFHEEFGELNERDCYIQRMKAEVFALIGGMALNDKQMELDVEDAVTGIVASSSLLGFYIISTLPHVHLTNWAESVILDAVYE